jgi:hypothetical protein
MRHFNDLEKRLLEKMVELFTKSASSNIVSNIIDEYVTGIKVKIIPKKGAVEFLFETHSGAPSESEKISMLERVNSLSVVIVTFINLLQYLEREGLALVFKRALPDAKEILFGRQNPDAKTFAVALPDKEIAKAFAKYVEMEFVLTQTLVQLVRGGYMTPSEKTVQYTNEAVQRGLRMAWYGIFAAIFVGVIGFAGYWFFGNSTVKQLDGVEKKFDNIITSIQSVNSTLVKASEKQDTINTRVISMKAPRLDVRVGNKLQLEKVQVQVDTVKAK